MDNFAQGVPPVNLQNEPICGNDADGRADLSSNLPMIMADFKGSLPYNCDLSTITIIEISYNALFNINLQRIGFVSSFLGVPFFAQPSSLFLNAHIEPYCYIYQDVTVFRSEFGVKMRVIDTGGTHHKRWATLSLTCNQYIESMMKHKLTVCSIDK